MDIKDYAQMMGYLTRPRDVVPDPSTMDQEPQRTGFSNGGGYDYGSMQYKIDSVNAAFRKYKKGSLTGGRKGTMTFEQFAPIWAKENFAEGGRTGFYKGSSAVQSHGAKIIELTEAGESSVSIAKKLGLKQQTVSNALNAIDSGIAGDDYKLSKPLKDFFKPKNQFSGKELTKNEELIANITEDAPFMSQKELIEKYKINKNTLTTIRDENNLKFRQSYLPTGTQKKEIPYADRYSAVEKSEMYKKRKATETEEDRINARERKKKYEDKVYKEYKMEPSSREPFDDLWKDIARSSKEGDRIQLIEGPKYSSGASYDDFKTRVFLDTKTGETFNYNNLKQYLDSGKLEGVTYNSVIEPYDIKNQIAKSGLREDIQKAYFGKKYQPPKRFRSQNTFHVHHIGGVAADPFKVQLTFALDNMGLVHNKTFNENWAKLIKENAPLSKRKEYLKFVKSKIGDNIAQTLDFPEVGRTRTFGEIGTNMQKLLSNKKFKAIDNKQFDLIKTLNTIVSKGGSKGKAAAQILAILGGTTVGASASDASSGTSSIVKNAAIGGGAAATIGTKTGRKVLSNLLSAAGVPLSLGFNAIYGIDPESSLDRTILGAEAALAPAVVKDAIRVTDKIKNPLLKKTAQALAGVKIPKTFINPTNMLKAARFLNPIGIATLAGEAVYNVGKLGYEDQKRFDALSPEEQAAERAEQEKFAFDVEGS